MKITEAYLRQVIRKQIKEMYGEEEKYSSASEEMASNISKGAAAGVVAGVVPMWLMQYFSEHPEVLEAVKKFIEESPLGE